MSTAVAADPLPAIATLHPASFALVMATGIVSIACHLLGLPSVALPLLWLNAALYVVLWGLTALRAARFGQQLLADVAHHGRAVDRAEESQRAGRGGREGHGTSFAGRDNAAIDEARDSERVWSLPAVYDRELNLLPCAGVETGRRVGEVGVVVLGQCEIDAR